MTCNFDFIFSLLVIYEKNFWTNVKNQQCESMYVHNLLFLLWFDNFVIVIYARAIFDLI